ncbi:MAG TPA: hypothetical protein VGJ21_22125 [Terracidiphilus sp.]|jgi:hypothetical protein
MTVVIAKPEDWSSIAALGGPVVDPMILRCGEVFLRGAANAHDRTGAWDLLNQNIHALGSFFDRLILDERIPVFNYADTFDLGQNFAQHTLAAVNENEEVLVDVNVRYAAYMEVKTAALHELSKLYTGDHAGVDAQQADRILDELTSSGYAWYPDLGTLALANSEERRLAAYILGGLIFGAYAQLAGADHLMQPKRSRLFLALTLKQDTSRGAEDYLFTKLSELTGRPATEIPYTPTFFPLLLKESTDPQDMLKRALKYRHSGEVRDYRAWLHAALDDFNHNGYIAIERFREVDRIASAIRGKLAGIEFPKVEIKTTVADIAALKPPGVGIDLTGPAKSAWGWMIGELPGKRHRKLLTRALIADREYIAIGIRTSTVWSGPGLPA